MGSVSALYFDRMYTFSRRSGFTILEVLIVLAVFGLLAAFAVFSLNTARERTRDAQRLSDVSVLRSALNQYYLENNTFPLSGGVLLGQAGAKTQMLTSSGFAAQGEAQGKTYLERVPVGPKANEFYKYHGSANGYSLRFQTESDTVYGKANVFYAHFSGIDGKDEDK